MNGKMIRARAFAILLLLGQVMAANSAETTAAESAASAAPQPADGTLKFVVALFRHGIRSPTPNFKNTEADKHSGNPWPILADWNVMTYPPPGDCDAGNGWVYLTKHGQSVVQGLGEYYGNYYKPAAFYFWADAGNQRTRETANALAAGIKKAVPSASVTVAFASPSPCQDDPLFHPFKSQCGKPDSAKLQSYADAINGHKREFRKKFAAEFQQLSKVLNCTKLLQCKPVMTLRDDATKCVVPSKECGAPLQWKQRFAYASSASEAFLLEYANNMNDVGWGGVDSPKMRDMLKLHEFYFDKTDRFLREDNHADDALASIEGSNLSREILDQFLRKAGRPRPNSCPRANANSDFVGLVGHDTNLASVGALLDLHWQFDDPKLPADTLNLPANDALPAGALVFELRQRSDGTYLVRVEYVTQSLDQMRNGTQ